MLAGVTFCPFQHVLHLGHGVYRWFAHTVLNFSVPYGSQVGLYSAMYQIILMEECDEEK